MLKGVATFCCGIGTGLECLSGEVLRCLAGEVLGCLAGEVLGCLAGEVVGCLAGEELDCLAREGLSSGGSGDATRGISILRRGAEECLERDGEWFGEISTEILLSVSILCWRKGYFRWRNSYFLCKN